MSGSEFCLCGSSIAPPPGRSAGAVSKEMPDMAKGQPIDTHIPLDHEPELNKYFKAAVKQQASDLHLKAGQVPKMRLQGALKNTNVEPFTREKVEQMAYEIMSPAEKEYFLQKGNIDFGYELTETDRFRVNIFRQRGAVSIVARRIIADIPPFDSLHLPAIVHKLAECNDGLILVVGPSGCGKTTTIATMVDYINTTQSCHIVTIEDPIEYLHRDKKSLVSQREIGTDVADYSEALQCLMRQDPDVVVIGEVDNKETMAAAMRAAETGHLVFATMHSSNAVQTIQRVIDLFPSEERGLARQTLSTALRAIISQVLLPCRKAEIKRIPANEVLLMNSAIKKIIADGRETSLTNIIRESANEGMLDFTESLRKLVEQDYIDVKVATEYAPNVDELKMALKGIRGSYGA
jgi:twitching motility protein PilT